MNQKVRVAQRLVLVAEIEADSPTAAAAKLDAFREAVQPSAEYGITLYRGELLKDATATSGDDMFQCQNCGYVGYEANFTDAQDLMQRVGRGERFTDLECANCEEGALAHLLSREASPFAYACMEVYEKIAALQDPDSFDCEVLEMVMEALGRMKDFRAIQERSGN